MNTLVFAFAGAVFAINVAVTIALLRSKSFNRGQLVGQSLLVWLVPAIGAIVVWFVFKEESRPFRGASNEANELTEWQATNYESSHHESGGGHEH